MERSTLAYCFLPDRGHRQARAVSTSRPFWASYCTLSMGRDEPVVKCWDGLDGFFLDHLLDEERLVS